MDSINLLDPLVLTGLFVGAMLPFLFSAMTMKSVGKAAFDMIEEVRRQFRTIPGIMEGTAEPDYEKCVSISTEAALREMIPPGILIMGTPLFGGFPVWGSCCCRNFGRFSCFRRRSRYFICEFWRSLGQCQEIHREKVTLVEKVQRLTKPQWLEIQLVTLSRTLPGQPLTSLLNFQLFSAWFLFRFSFSTAVC